MGKIFCIEFQMYPTPEQKYRYLADEIYKCSFIGEHFFYFDSNFTQVYS